MKREIFVQISLVTLALLFLGLFLLLPLAAIFIEAFAKGAQAYLGAISDPDTLAAVQLTLLTVAIAVPLNLIFGLAAAWLISHFDFRGRGLLVTLIDLPLAVSPVIAGMMFVLLYGSRGILGPMLDSLGLKVIYAAPGIVIATTFVTLPFIARELIPLMVAQGSDEEHAAMTMGARGLRVFWSVTLPKIKWGLLYGLVLANARAMGEFGAVSVVSGHIRGVTNTMPLQVEILYNEYNFAAAFAVSSLLALLSVLTLAAKSALAWFSTGD